MRRAPGRGLLAALALAAAAPAARAQNPAWTANLIVQPNPSPFVADWNRNPTIAILTVLYTGRAGQSFRVEAFARSGSTELGRVISPPLSFAFGPSTQLITASDILNWNTESSNQTYVNLVERTGRLPEGPLQLCARVLDPSNAQLTQTCTSVTIALPNAPQLIYPTNAGIVTAAQPVFQWTPVVVPPSVGLTYHVKIAAVGAQQAPTTALSANIPVYDADIGGMPLFTYPLNGLPLESGKQYAWQIQALDQNGLPITRGGTASQIWTFTLGGPGRPNSLLSVGFGDTLTLLPGVARLSGLANATVTETPFAYVLDGQATLNVLAPFTGTVRVTLQGLQVDKRTRALTAGSLSGTLTAGFLPAGYGNPFVKYAEIAYDPQSGLSLSGALALPGVNAPLSGAVHLTAAGLSGDLTAGTPGGATLATLGADPAAFRVQTADISLPSAKLTLGGAVDLFGQDVGCDAVSGSVDAQGNLSASVACRPSTPVALVPGVTRLQLGLTAVSGTFGAALGGGTTSYQLTAAGQVALDAGGAPCGGSVSLTVANGGVTPGTFSASCSPSLAADLGWLAAQLSDLRLQRLAYAAGQGFDFAFQVNLAPFLPTATGITLPSSNAVVVDRSGITVPATSVSPPQSAVQVAGFGLALTRVALPAFTLAWKDWQAHAASGFSFSVDGKVSYAGLGSAMPACLSGTSLVLAGATLANGQLAATATDQDFTPPCSIPLGGGAAFQLQKLGGSVTIAFAPSLSATASPTATGALLLPNFFTCANAGDRTLALTTTVTLSPPGLLTGHVSGLTPACPMGLAAIQVALTGAALDFTVTSAGAQSAILTGGASASFGSSGGTVNGSGSISIDLIAGRLVSGSLTFQGPFELDVPRSPGLLAFTVNSAVLDNSGLTVDGRAKLNLPNQLTVNATFDQVKLNPLTAAVISGKILFDAPFALEFGVAADGSLTWSALGAGAALGVTTGVRLDLPTQLAVDPRGLTASGTAGGHLVYGGRDLDGLAITYSSDFAFGINPAGVTSGSASIAWKGATVGTVDVKGFHPDLGAFATQLIPDTLGLPSKGVAYVVLKDANGNLLVSTQQVSAGERIYTAPGVTLPVVFPALMLGRTAAPQVNVSLDVTLDPLTGLVSSGSVGASFPATTPGFDLSAAGLPFAVDSFAFTAAAGASPSLALVGQLALFGQQLAGSAPVSLAVDQTGNLTGTVSVTPANPASIQLVPGFAGLELSVSSVTGSFTTSLLTGSLKYDLSAATTLSVGSPGLGAYNASATVEVSDQGFKVGQLTLPAGASGVADLGVVRLALSNLQVPALSYDATRKTWSFDFTFDAGLQFPQLASLTLPTVQGVELTPHGFTIPTINMPHLALSPVSVLGFVISPVAFRTAGPITYNWFTGRGPSNWGFGFDLSLAFGSGAPTALQNPSLTVLNAGITNGVFTGQIEPLTLPSPISLATGTVTQLGGALQAVQQTANGVTKQLQGINVTATGQFAYPALLQCSAAPQGSVAFTVGLDATGTLSGTVSNVVPKCPVQLGPLALQVTASSLTFGTNLVTGSQKAELDGTAQLSLPAPSGTGTVSGTGQLGVDLLAGTIVSGSIALNQPFKWSFPAKNPFLNFTVASAVLDMNGFTLSGTGSLVLPGGNSVGATISNLQLGVPDFSIKAGSISFQSAFSLAVGLSGSSLQWSVGTASAPPPTSAGLVITTPQTVAIGPSGLQLNGTGTAALSFNSTTLGQLTTTFTNGFAISLATGAVSAGTATLANSSGTVATVDANGFHPGNLFALVPLPDSLPLGTYDVGFVMLMDKTGKLAVSTSAAGLATTSQQGVALVIKALHPSHWDTLFVTFSAVVAGQLQSGWSITSGSISVQAASGQSVINLSNVGLPLSVTRVAYNNTQGTWGLYLDASVELPSSLASAPLVFTNLGVTAQGLSGTATIGTWPASGKATDASVATATVGTGNTITFTGAQATFTPGSQAVAVAGRITSALFTASGQATPILFTGNVSSAGAFAATMHASALPPLSLGSLSFTPEDVNGSPAFGISGSGTSFTATLSGTLGLTALGSEAAVTVGGLSFGTGGVTVSSVSFSAGAQTLTLFGQTLTLKDESQYETQQGKSLTCPEVAVSDTNTTLYVTLSGELTVLGNTAHVCGLTVASDGSVSVTQAALISGSVSVIPNVMTLDALTIASTAASQAGQPQVLSLSAAVTVTLPAPLGGPTPDHGTFTIASDGTVSGGGTIQVYEPTTPTTFPIGSATVAVQDVQLTVTSLGTSSSSPSGQIGVVAAICIGGSASSGQGSCGAQGSSTPTIAIGSVNGGSVSPGVTVGWDGSVAVSNLSIQNGPVSIDSSFFVFAIDKVSGSAAIPASGAKPTFSLTIGGTVGVTLPSITSTVTFQNFGITSDGHVHFDPTGIQNGTFSVAGIIALDVTTPVISTSQTQVWVPSGSAPSSSSSATTPDSTQVTADFYVSFGGKVDIGGGAFEAGVNRVLFYHTTSGETHFLVDDAAFAISGVVSMEATLSYTADASTGAWNVLVGGSATVPMLGNAGLILVGDVGVNTSGQPQVGIFVAANGLQITLAPTPVTITGLGGGFFLNPDPGVIPLVQKLCGVAPDYQPAPPPMSATSVAVMLYAAVGIVSDELINGQVLFTVTNNELDIDGKVSIIAAIQGAGDSLVGKASLTITFGQPSVSGSVHVYVGIAGIVSGDGGINFALYSPTAWSINGTFEATVAGMLDAKGSLSFSPAGFLMGGSVSAGINVGIASISGGITAQVWFIPGQSWGGYVKASVTASVLGGLVSVTGSLTGALIDAPSQGLEIYASASLTASAMGQSWTGTVWVQFVKGNVSAGFGDDATMDQAIAAAEGTATQLNNDAAAAVAAIAAAQSASYSVSLSAAELSQAYATFTSIVLNATSPDGRGSAQALLGFAQLLAINIPELAFEDVISPNPNASYFVAYDSIMGQKGAPSDTTTVQKLADSVSTGLAAAQNLMPGVKQKLATAQVQTNQLAQTPPPAFPTQSPISVVPTTASDGTPIPTFNINPGAASQGAAAAQAGQAQAKAYENAIRQQASQLEQGLANVQAAMTDASASSFLSLVRQIDQVEQAAEQQYARQADLMLRRKAWALAKDAGLESQQATAQQLAGSVGDSLVAHTRCSTRDPGTNLPGMVSAFVQLLSGLTGADSILTDYKSDSASFYKQNQSNAQYGCGSFFQTRDSDYAYALFYQMPDYGLQAMARTIDSAYTATSQTAATRIGSIRTLQGTLSGDYNKVALSEVALGWTLHDLYARYLAWKSAQAAGTGTTRLMPKSSTLGGSATIGAGSGGGAAASPAGGGSAGGVTGGAGGTAAGNLAAGKGATMLTGATQGFSTSSMTTVAGVMTAATPVSLVPNFDDTTSVKARIAQLEQALTVPTVGSIQVAPVLTTPYMAELQATWSGAGGMEYEWADVSGTDAALAPGFGSTGTSAAHTLWVFAPSSTKGGPAGRTFQAAVRTAAGYVGYGRENYTITFSVPTASTGSSAPSAATVTSAAAADKTLPGMPSIFLGGVNSAYDSYGETVYWSTDPSHVEVSYSAGDNQSGISAYQVAAVYGNPLTGIEATNGTGTAQQPLSQTGTTTGSSSSGSQTGSTWTGTLPVWASVGARTDYTLDQLKLASTRLKATTILVRAASGQGVLGHAGFTGMIFYDSTPPAWPASSPLKLSGIYTPPPAPTGFTAAGGRLTPAGPTPASTVAACTVNMPPLPAPPAATGTVAGANISAGLHGIAGGVVTGTRATYSGALTGNTSAAASGLPPGAATPSISFKVPTANPPTSGIRDYWYYVGPASIPFDPGSWTKTAAGASITVSGGSFDFTHTFYAAVVTRNWSNVASTPLATTFTPLDPTPPSAPAFCVGMSETPGVLAVHLTTPASDLESGILGYQYWIEDATTQSSARAFPASPDSVDWPSVSGDTTLHTPLLSLVNGHSYLVGVRAINNQRDSSTFVASGAFIYDATPPPAPAVTAASDATGIMLTLHTYNDLQSGLKGLQLAVGTSDSTDDVVKWNNVTNVALGSTTLHLAATLAAKTKYYVRVREVNGVGWPGPMGGAMFATPGGTSGGPVLTGGAHP